MIASYKYSSEIELMWDFWSRFPALATVKLDSFMLELYMYVEFWIQNQKDQLFALSMKKSKLMCIYLDMLK